jgi:ATP-dependent Clp protease ATP-binding subunit ClpC
VYGARPLKRAVQSKIEDEFAEQILDGKIKDGDEVVLKAQEDKVIITTK